MWREQESFANCASGVLILGGEKKMAESIERFYKTDESTLERLLKDFTRKWFGVEGNSRAPFVGVGVERDDLGQLVVGGRVPGYADALGVLTLTRLTSTPLNERPKVETWAMDWKDCSDCKKIVDEFFAALIQYLDRIPGLTDANTQPTANQTAEGQAESKVKRIFGLRTKYLIAAVILWIFIIFASLLLFPEWARSNLTVVVLAAFLPQ